MNHDTISIIIPCYNAERFIDICLESILGQTYRNFEILLIDDGSTDRTAPICDRWALADHRIRAIHKKNGGVSSARNAGLAVAKGEWVTFVDIDDTLKSDALETLLNHATDSTDIVFAGFEIYQNGKISNKIPVLKERKISAIELAGELMSPSDYHYQGFICSKLYRRQIITDNGISFQENIKYNEDRLFTFTFLTYATEGFYTTRPVYEYKLSGDGAMASINGPGFWKFETDLDAFLIMNKLAARFKSRKLRALVYKNTYGSYCWNRRLNRTYGGDSAETTHRLKTKLRSVVPLTVLVGYRLSEYKAALIYKLKKHVG